MKAALLFAALAAALAPARAANHTYGDLAAFLETAACPGLLSAALPRVPLTAGLAEATAALPVLYDELLVEAVAGAGRGPGLILLAPTDDAWSAAGVGPGGAFPTAAALVAARNADGPLLVYAEAPAGEAEPKGGVTLGARAKVAFTYSANGAVTVEGPTGAALAAPFEFDCGAGPGARAWEVPFAAEPPGAGEAGAVAAAAARAAGAVADRPARARPLRGSSASAA